jgi:hypothetical protein
MSSRYPDGPAGWDDDEDYTVYPTGPATSTTAPQPAREAKPSRGQQLLHLAATGDLPSHIPLIVAVPAALFTLFGPGLSAGMAAGFGLVVAAAVYQLVKGSRANRRWWAGRAAWAVVATLTALLIAT